MSRPDLERDDSVFRTTLRNNLAPVTLVIFFLCYQIFRIFYNVHFSLHLLTLRQYLISLSTHLLFSRSIKCVKCDVNLNRKHPACPHNTASNLLHTYTHFQRRYFCPWPVDILLINSIHLASQLKSCPADFVQTTCPSSRIFSFSQKLFAYLRTQSVDSVSNKLNSKCGSPTTPSFNDAPLGRATTTFNDALLNSLIFPQASWANEFNSKCGSPTTSSFNDAPSNDDPLRRATSTSNDAPLKRATSTSNDALLNSQILPQASWANQFNSKCESATTPSFNNAPLGKATTTSNDALHSSLANWRFESAHKTDSSEPPPAECEWLLKKTYVLIRPCIKELIVLLEAKSNRNERIDVKAICYRHVVNVLAVCVFGKKINELTNSRCPFYQYCEQVYDLWMEGAAAGGGLLEYAKRSLHKVRVRSNTKMPSDAIQYFIELINEACQVKHDNRNLDDHHIHYGQDCLAKSLIEAFDLNSRNSSPDLTISSLLIAFSMHVLEVMTGVMSILLHAISTDNKLQANIRNTKNVRFNLQGLPDVNFQPCTIVDSLIKRSFEIYPLDAFVRVSCRRARLLPDTNIRVNPKCVILVPRQVLEVDSYECIDNTYSDIDPQINVSEEFFKQASNKEGSLADEKNTRVLLAFASNFVKVCLKTSVLSLIHEYEFETNVLSKSKDDGNLIRSLSHPLFISVAKMGHREKGVALAESLKLFHATKNNVSFLSKIGF